MSECRQAVDWNNLPVNSEQRDAGSCSISFLELFCSTASLLHNTEIILYVVLIGFKGPMSIIMSVWSLRHSLFDHYLCWKDTVPFLMGLQTVWVHFIYNYLIPKVVSVLLLNTNPLYHAPLRQFIHDGMFNSRCQRPHLISWIASRTSDLIHSLTHSLKTLAKSAK